MVMFSTHDTKPQYKQSKNQTGYTMKDWKTIKDNYAREQGYDDWNEILYSTDDPNELDIHIDAVSLLRAKATQENISENAFLEESIPNSAVYDTINKESTTDENNIPS